MKLSKFAVDAKKEEEGVWVSVDSDGAKILVARANNTRYREEFRKLLAPHRAAYRAGTLSEEIAGNILGKALARTILLGWEGIKNDDGTELVYSTKRAEEILCDPQYSDFRTLVEASSNDAELFRKTQLEEDVAIVKQ